MSPPVSNFERLTIDDSMPKRKGQPVRRLSETLSPEPSPGNAVQRIMSGAEIDATSRNEQTLATADAAQEALEGLEPGLFNALQELTSLSMEQRAIEVRDMLSTSDRLKFPSEFIKPNIYNRAALLDEPKSIEDCAEKEDIISTLFLLGVNRPMQFCLLRMLFPEDRCAQYFAEKLERRIDEQLNELDLLSSDTGGGTNLPEQIHAKVYAIATEMRRIVEVTRLDLDHRRPGRGEAEIGKHLVHLLQVICQRSYDSSRERTTRRNLRVGSTAGILFQILIGNAPDHLPKFGLDALGALSKEALAEQRLRLGVVRDLLEDMVLPGDYLKEFDRITGPVSGQKRSAGGNGRGEQKRPNRA